MKKKINNYTSYFSNLHTDDKIQMAPVVKRIDEGKEDEASFSPM